ncbi:MAG: tyrosine-type recombinase/integrase, partial [bacterium]
RFSKFSLSFLTNTSKPSLTKELVLAWCVKRPDEGARNCRRRIYPIRQFGIYLNALGYDAYVASADPKTNSFAFIPYIFTENEMDRIFSCSDQLYPNRRSAMHLIMPVILRMLYGCGLRISEAVNLQNKNVNLVDGILEVINGKFGKDRLVPMSDSLLTCCRQFYQVMHNYSTPDDYFFRSVEGKPVSADNVYRRFRDILWESGISHGGKGFGPRIHDLRHTFAVHSLKRVVENGTDVYCALPILSTYLGHASVTATEHYVRLTAEAFPDIQNVLDRYCGHVIPEVNWNETY